jgi:hypothetical protein
LASRREESLLAVYISSLQKRRKKFQEFFGNSRIKALCFKTPAADVVRRFEVAIACHSLFVGEGVAFPREAVSFPLQK